MNKLYTDLKLQKQLQRKIESDVQRVRAKSKHAHPHREGSVATPAYADSHPPTDFVEVKRAVRGGKRASLQDGSVDFVGLNSSFIRNINPIIRPRTKHSSSIHEYNLLLSNTLE